MLLNFSHSHIFYFFLYSNFFFILQFFCTLSFLYWPFLFEMALNPYSFINFPFDTPNHLCRQNKYRLHSRVGSKRTGTAPLCHSGNCVVCRPLTVPYDSGIVLSHFRRTEILITLPSGACTHRCRTYWRRGAIGEGSKPRQRRGDGYTKGYSGIASARRYQFTRPGIESNRSKLTRKTVNFHLWQYLRFLSLMYIIWCYNFFMQCFQNGKGNVVHLESRPSKEQGVQFDILAKVDMTRKDLLALMKTLRQSSTLASITILAEDNINVKNPWFPRHARDLDNCNHLMTKYEPELDMNHPGFSDKVYRSRRKEIANIAFEYKLYVT